MSGRVEGSVEDSGSEIDLEVTRETHGPSDIPPAALSQPKRRCAKRGPVTFNGGKGCGWAR